MKVKLFNALKQEYSNLGLSDDILQGQADSLAATGLVTDENLTTIVQGQKSFLSSLQSGIDKRVTDAVTKAKAEKKEEPKKEPEKKDEKTEDKDTPEWAKALIESNKTLQSEINSLKSGKVNESRLEKLNSVLKDADASYKTPIIAAFNRMAFADDSDFDAYINEVSESAKTFQETQSAQNLGVFPRPMGGKVGNGKEATKEEVADIVDGMKF